MDALKYALLTSSQFISMGNFSSALDYLEYAEEIARTEDEYQKILNVLKSAEKIANVKFSNDPKIDCHSSAQNSPIVEQTDHNLHVEAQNIDDPGDVHNKPQNPSSEEVAQLFYQRATLGSNGEDFIFDDFVCLHHRLNFKISQLTEKQTPTNTIQNQPNINDNDNIKSSSNTNTINSMSNSTSTSSKFLSSCVIS